MNQPEVHIQSYFSIDTDLASGFSQWPEFVGGQDYNVILRARDGTEVTIELIQKDETEFVSIKSNNDSMLFQQALGLATYLLSKHSDNIIISRRS